MKARLIALAELAAFLLGWWLLERVVADLTPYPLTEENAVRPGVQLLYFLLLAPAVTLLIVLLQRLRGRSLADLGLRRTGRSLRYTLLVGVAAGILIAYLPAPLLALLEKLGMEWIGDAFVLDSLTAWLAWSVSGIIAGGFMEELIFRGFLLDRLERLCGGPSQRAFLLAALLCNAEFARRHAYQGSLGMVSVFLVGLLLTAFYALCRRNLVPVMIAHASIDVFAFTVLWSEA